MSPRPNGPGGVGRVVVRMVVDGGHGKKRKNCGGEKCDK